MALVVKNIDLLLRASACCAPGRHHLREQIRTQAEALGILYTPPIPLLQGRDLILHGLHPGKTMGELLKKAFEAQLDGEFSDHAAAIEWLQKELQNGEYDFS